MTPPVHMRRIWCETLPYAHLRRPEVLRLLGARQLQLLLAVTPDRAADLPVTMAACRDAGLSVGLWPMLGRSEGRWPSAANLPSFRDFTLRCLDALAAHRLRPAVLAVDLEPPIGELDALLHGRIWPAWRWARRRDVGRAATALAAFVEEVHGRDLVTLAATLPTLVTDPARSDRGWQRALGTPVNGVPFGHVSPMMYTSLVEGCSRGLLRRRDTVALLAATARAAVSRWGPRASLSLGCVGAGILGDEPTWRSVEELAEDVGQARTAGVDDLALFDLAGVLARPPAEAWLDAFVHGAPSSTAARLTPRAALVGAATRAGGLFL